MSSDLERVLRRLGRARRPAPRPQNELAFLEAAPPARAPLLYDTTVYIDILRGSFPATLDNVLRARGVWHSAVAETELAAACARLDPAHKGTGAVVKQIASLLARLPAHRTIAPDRQVWREAGLLSGALARLQSIARSERHRVLNDALIFATARKHGHTVLTRNIRDFDLLQQLEPAGRVLFYRVPEAS